MIYIANLIGIYQSRVLVKANSPEEAEAKLRQAKSEKDFTRFGLEMEFIKTEDVEDVELTTLE